MRTAAIIAEYNPFHNGHAYHIEETRRLTGADRIVIIMSGSFVQRGTPAICDKHLRAKAALENGADLVLELPLSYAVGNAEVFASGAVEILDRLGIVDLLSFGTETDNLQELIDIAAFLNNETDEFKDTLKQEMASGKNYAQARASAMPKINAALFSSPNAILGIEYIRALKKRKSSIQPFIVCRQGAGYNDTSLQSGQTNANFASATAIRKVLLSDRAEEYKAKLSELVPEGMLSDLYAELSHHGLLCEDDFSLLLHEKILTSSDADLVSHPSINEDLSNRIRRHQYRFKSFSTFADLLKCKNYTHSRIRRALAEILLDLGQPAAVDKVRVLGCRKEALELLSEISSRGSVSLVTSLSKEECFWQSDTLYEMILAHKKKTPMTPEPSKGMIVYDFSMETSRLSHHK